MRTLRQSACRNCLNPSKFATSNFLCRWWWRKVFWMSSLLVDGDTISVESAKIQHSNEGDRRFCFTLELKWMCQIFKIYSVSTPKKLEKHEFNLECTNFPRQISQRFKLGNFWNFLFFTEHQNKKHQNLQTHVSHWL